MLISWIAWIIASVSAGLQGPSADAEPVTFGEPPTLELALAGIATLLVYSLAQRSFWRRKHVTDAYPQAATTHDIAAAVEEPSRDAA